MSRGTFHSAAGHFASGLRPTTAFFGVGVVLIGVLVRSASLSVQGACTQPDGIVREGLPCPDFDITDRDGRTLARSVKRLDLEISPRAMWQAHTPDYMAGLIAEVLGEEIEADELLAYMLPDAKEGVIEAGGALASIDFDGARRVRAFLDGRGVDSIWLERKAAGRFALVWRPVEALSSETRSRGEEDGRDPGPMRWTRRLVRELAIATGRVVPREKGPSLPSIEQLKRVWSELMPAAFAVVLEGLSSEASLELHALLDEEGVHAHQMCLRFVPERRYPMRGAETGSRGFEILGHWRYIAEPEARRMAAAEFRLRDPRDCPPDLQTRFDRRVAELLDLKHPRSGLEGLCSKLLAEPRWDALRPAPASYAFRFDRPVHNPARRYYIGDVLETDTPRVVSTLDADLQGFLRGKLEELRKEHDPALAMAIAIDVESGDVLAVDGLSPYQTAEFLPTYHLFTPGSTFKVIVMATALDAGVVSPDESFDTHDGTFRIPGSSRVIREAEGPPGGWRTATEALAYSINAVMAQIGMRVPDERFHAKLKALGYGTEPGTGLGVERAGLVPKLPWKPAWSHASVSFGHELMVSMWQHATGLATVLRGGVMRPLRVTRAIECDGEQHPLPIEAGTRVYSREACQEVRRMMVLGAQVGTGDDLWAQEKELGTQLKLATKTGTAEKVPSEVCLHLELGRNEYNQDLELELGNRKRAKDDPRWIEFRALKGAAKPHRRSCYTSSICALGSVPGQDREVMVLVVVEEPRGKSKYGSQVAGPAAMSILKEALSLTSGGRVEQADVRVVPLIDYEAESNPWERPWDPYEAGNRALDEVEDR